MSIAEARRQHWLAGHATAQATLVEAATAGRLPHAWLFTGPKGIGKATLAFRFARWLLCGQVGTTLDIDESNPTARRVAAGTHADLFSIGLGFDEKKQRHRGEIVADEVRPIGEFLRRTAAEGGWRAVIVDDADQLNRHAANALLKILEEPPDRAVLILVSNSPGLLLPTIRSRCRTLRLDPLADTDMLPTLRRLLPDQADYSLQALLPLSDGAPGRAIALAAADGVALQSAIARLLSDQAGLTAGQEYGMVEQVMRGEGGFSTFLSLLRGTISARLRRQARGEMPNLPPGPDWPVVWQRLGRVQIETERFNLDKRQALLSSLSLLSER